MRVGVDFDNTIVSYDALFHRIARERGLIPADVPANKTAVRDHLRATGREEVWTGLQGEVYGARMAEAEVFPGALEFFTECRRQGIPVCIISHKTRHPYLGANHDLHAAARQWLHAQGFFQPGPGGLGEGDVFFEPTKAAKLARIGAAGCTHFIDDLPELLSDPAFPAATRGLHFNPPTAAWAHLRETLLGDNAWRTAADVILSAQAMRAAGPAETLAGGANNRVCRLPLDHGDGVLVKRYFQHVGDNRDRFATERAFYRHAAAAQLAQVPVAIGWDERERIGVFSYVSGRRPAAAEPRHIDAALRFVGALNRHRHTPEADALPAASEACFSLDAHLATVRRRIERLAVVGTDDPLDVEARHVIDSLVWPAWLAAARGLRDQFPAGARASELPLAQRCISPSDFGFHNSLVTAHDRIVFFDFEYAGWDDPAKLVCDFFCQPEVPVPSTAFDGFVTAIATELALADVASFTARCHHLLPLYQVKWSCILLNEFTPPGRSRRAFALGAEAATARRARQLARVRTMLCPLPAAA